MGLLGKGMLRAVPRLREASLHLSADATPFLQIIQFLSGQAVYATSRWLPSACVKGAVTQCPDRHVWGCSR